MFDQEYELPEADVCLVRGKYTIKNMHIDDSTPVGDPGLIADRLVLERKSISKYDIGIVLHYVDKDHPWKDFVQKNCMGRVKFIDVRQSPKKVLKEILECDLILSSSLHGLIVADSLGKPNIWIKLSNKIVGDDFKFSDYGTSINHEMVPIIVKTTTSIKEIEQQFKPKDSKAIEIAKSNIDKVFREKLSLLSN